MSAEDAQQAVRSTFALDAVMQSQEARLQSLISHFDAQSEQVRQIAKRKVGQELQAAAASRRIKAAVDKKMMALKLEMEE